MGSVMINNIEYYFEYRLIRSDMFDLCFGRSKDMFFILFNWGDMKS